MKIKITGRHINVSDNLREYAEKKVSKLEKYFQQLIDTHLIMYVEKLDHAAELVINGDAVQFHAREKAADFYSAIDLLIDKMESQIVRYKEKIQSRKGQGAEKSISFDITSLQGKEAALSQVSTKPIDNIEAFLQMKIDKKDYILFKKGVSEVESSLDYSNKNYALIFKADDKFKLVEIPFDKIKDNEFNCDTFLEYELNVLDESSSNPKIEFNKTSSCNIEKFTLDEAMDTIEGDSSEFMPFFISDTGYFNILCR